MAIFDDGIKAFLEAYTYFSRTLGKGREKLAKELAEQSTGVKAPEKLEPVIPGNEVINLPNKTEKRLLMSINSTFSNPLKSDFVLSKIDGTAGSKYSVLKSELDRMSPKVTQDLQYAKDNQLALTTAQKNNLVQNVKLERQLKQELKRLETDLIADKKDPQMIYDAYTTASKKPSSESIMGRAEKLKELSEGLTETYSKAKADLIKQNNFKNKYDSRAYNSNYEGAYRQIARNFLIAEQKAGRIEMPTNIYQRISFGGSDPVIDPIKLFRYHYGDDAFDKIPVDQLEKTFAKKGLREQDYKYTLRQAGITPIKQKGPKTYAQYATPKELKAELLEIDTMNDQILAGDSPIFQTKSEIVNAIRNNNNRRAKFATILKDMEFKKMLDEEITPDFVKKVAEEKAVKLKDTPKKAGKGRFTKSEVLIERLKNTLKTDKDPYVQENFPNFIKELEAKPELANIKKVFDELGGPLPKNQRLVEYDDGTVDFYTQGGKGGKGMESANLLAKELGISRDEAIKIKMMEPEDQILEIQRRKTLMEKETPIVREGLDDEAVEIAEQKILDDENVIDIEDYFDKDDMARGGIVSIR